MPRGGVFGPLEVGVLGCQAGLSGLAGLPSDRQSVSLNVTEQQGKTLEPRGLGPIFSLGK